MNVAEICTREVLVIRAEQPLLEAAQLMQRHGVGALVVIEEQGGSLRPVGMLTDRDVVCGQFAHQADVRCLTVAEVMAAPAATVAEGCSLEQAIEVLRARAVRRAPVVNGAGELVGIITLDDLLPALAGELDALSQLIGSQVWQARRGEPTLPR
ncbi:MAG TPA: CBS domain-containing protein [Steroidobacteraceae bacterium]|nr:CBS domain-containing protein [Steroidobacteraceae bacterium]